MRGIRHIPAALAVLFALAIAVPGVGAHKPITSPFSYNEDVFPILRDRCGACHLEGGIGPMSLMTHEATVPWGESIRLELIAGHMPPWSATSGAGVQLRRPGGLSARELNVLLTWVTGGTPPGAAGKAPPPMTAAARWPLGPPDASVPLPEYVVAADAAEATAEFVIRPDAATGRWLRAVDLLPGTPAIVRSARIAVRVPDGAPEDAGVERIVALWVPGDDPVALEPDAAFALPPGAELLVRIRYRKAWDHERDTVSDRSVLGLYFAEGRHAEVRAVTMRVPPPAPAPAGGAPGRISARAEIRDDVRALSLYPMPALAGADVHVEAVLPDGTRQRVIAFAPRAGWERRYWFDRPLDWPAGTRLEVSGAFDTHRAALPPALPAAPSALPAPSTSLLVVNVVPRP